MSYSSKLTNLLDALQVKYEPLAHRTVFTAYDLAQTLRRDLSEIAKSVVVKADGQHLVIVLPASHLVDFKKLKAALKAKKVEIAKEGIVTGLFKAKPGLASPLLAPALKLPVYVDKALAKAKSVVVQGGTFEEALHLKAKDFLKATNAQLAVFAMKNKGLRLQAKRLVKKARKAKKAVKKTRQVSNQKKRKSAKKRG